MKNIRLTMCFKYRTAIGLINQWQNLFIHVQVFVKYVWNISIVCWCARSFCDKICQCLAAGLWSSPGTLVSATNKPGRHDITEILLKVALNTIPPQIVLKLQSKTIISLSKDLISTITKRTPNLLTTYLS